MHVIAGKAPGHEPWSTQVKVTPEQDHKAVEVPKFKELPKLAHIGAMATPSPLTKRRKIALGIASGGAVIAGVALGFGLDARGLRDDALAACPPESCTPEGAARAQSKNDRARNRATIANVGFATAGAAVVAGAVLWFLSPPERAGAVSVVPQANGLAVMGRF